MAPKPGAPCPPTLGGGGTFWGAFSWVLTRVGHHPLCFGALTPPFLPFLPSLGTNNSESRKTKKKKPHLGLVSGAPGLGSSKKKKPKPPAPHTPSIYDDIN